jgi:hypothetical protein
MWVTITIQGAYVRTLAVGRLLYCSRFGRKENSSRFVGIRGYFNVCVCRAFLDDQLHKTFTLGFLYKSIQVTASAAA